MSAPLKHLNHLFAIKEACVKACGGVLIPPQIEVEPGKRKARSVSRRGETLAAGDVTFDVSASFCKSGLSIALAFSSKQPELKSG